MPYKLCYFVFFCFLNPNKSMMHFEPSFCLPEPTFCPPEPLFSVTASLLFCSPDSSSFTPTPFCSPEPLFCHSEPLSVPRVPFCPPEPFLLSPRAIFVAPNPLFSPPSPLFCRPEPPFYCRPERSEGSPFSLSLPQEGDFSLTLKKTGWCGDASLPLGRTG